MDNKSSHGVLQAYQDLNLLSKFLLKSYVHHLYIEAKMIVFCKQPRSLKYVCIYVSMSISHEGI